MQRSCRELATNLCKELSHKRNLKRRIPLFDATSVKNVKNYQKLPGTFRNIDLEIALLQFAALQNSSSCNKRMHQNAELQNWGAAVLAPHGAFRYEYYIIYVYVYLYPPTPPVSACQSRWFILFLLTPNSHILSQLQDNPNSASLRLPDSEILCIVRFSERLIELD